MKTNHKTELLLLIVVVIALIGSHFIQYKFYENYENMNIELLPGTYPLTVDKPILVKDYPLKKPASLNAHTQNLWKDYPVFSSSYQQRTNNVEYWPSPNNGKCSPLEFCGSMYDNKKVIIPPGPKPVPLDSDAIRVNYYASKK
jgi:hypothetical protein